MLDLHRAVITSTLCWHRLSYALKPSLDSRCILVPLSPGHLGALFSAVLVPYALGTPNLTLQGRYVEIDGSY